jgi:hypothetical protein
MSPWLRLIARIGRPPLSAPIWGIAAAIQEPGRSSPDWQPGDAVENPHRFILRQWIGQIRRSQHAPADVRVRQRKEAKAGPWHSPPIGASRLKRRSQPASVRRTRSAAAAMAGGISWWINLESSDASFSYDPPRRINGVFDDDSPGWLNVASDSSRLARVEMTPACAATGASDLVCTVQRMVR